MDNIKKGDKVWTFSDEDKCFYKCDVEAVEGTVAALRVVFPAESAGYGFIRQISRLSKTKKEAKEKTLGYLKERMDFYKKLIEEQ